MPRQRPNEDHDMISRLKRWIGLGEAAEHEARPIWLVDREGVVYLPERRVVLKART